MTENKDENDVFDAVDSEIDNDFEEETELTDIEANSEQQIKQLKAKLKECEREKAEHLENLQRAKAEFLNAKRRVEEEKGREKERVENKQIEKLLPLCDSFFIAKSNTQAWEAIDATWRTGIESIYTQLQNILSSYGVHEINPLGEKFDPNLHEALTNVPTDTESNHDTVMSVIQTGFVRTMGEKTELIRPARVTVGEFTK